MTARLFQFDQFFRLRHACLIGLFSLSAVSPVVGQVPVVHRMDTSAVVPAMTAHVSVHGEQLQNAHWLWTEFALFRPVDGYDAAADKQVTFTGVVPRGVEPGVHAARVITATGCSRQLFLVVDSVPTTPLKPESEDRTTPQLVDLNTAIAGFVTPLKSRSFQLNLSEGQTVQAQVFARRLNSELDPVLRIVGPSGREIAFCDDVPGLEGDAELSWTASATGLYRVELSDVAWGGGGKHFFHLRLGTYRLQTVPESGDSVATALVEQEPNNSAETASDFPATAGRMHGTLNPRGDTDWYRLSLAESGPLSIVSLTQSLYSAADLVLRLYEANGKLVREVDESLNADAAIFATLPEGEYLLQVSDLGLSGGPQWQYELICHRSGRVDLHIPADSVMVPQDGSAAIAATVHRSMFDGPLRLEIEGLPSGVTSPALILSPQQETVPLTFTAASDFSNAAIQDWSAVRFKLSGLSGEEFASRIIVAPRPRKKADGPFLTAQNTGTVFCAGSPQTVLSLQASTDQIMVRRGDAGTFDVTLTRHPEWTMPVDVTLAVPANQLPPGVSVANVRIEGPSGTISVATTAEAPAGTFTLFLQGTAKKDKTTTIQPVSPVRVTIQEQLTTPAETVTED
jgi:hypothetical protein